HIAKTSQNPTASSNVNAPISTEMPAQGVSAALAAMQARKQLQETQAQLDQTEKKKPELVTPKPINTNKQPANLQERFMNLAVAQQQATQEKANAKPVAIAKPTSDEEYRWTWLNPELENQDESAKPSDIKQAILQERTPELVEKTISLSCEQDKWCKLVNELALGGLSRQLALNSYLSDTQNNELHLVLKPAMAHLDNPESRQSLATALLEKGFTYQLTLGESTENKTPLEIRRAIFEQLTVDAKNALFSDEKLMLLRQAFDAEIDESTIRAVANPKAHTKIK
ncbi:DNA polymerase III subunit gamma/tau C-terminal domain-containing protein, partial [Actinobacillus minor]|uniref:DNA polymerase III subunit gamma/tau C-terminal domain-containing protein n=1 Tax=Actinobacillus minor TaxID=51047 RepID=UPI002A83E1C1